MTNNELIMLQALPLEVKVLKTKQRIREYVNYFGENHVYISFSGGKDSTVLLHLIREEYPDIKAVFVDTGLEFPELKQFVRTIENIITLRPSMNFKEVINTYGYPVTSKEQAQYLHDIRYSTPYMKARRIHGDSQGRFKLSNKWHKFIDSDIKVSHKCCDIMKKKPIKQYEKQNDVHAIIGTMASESSLRKSAYLRNGCNSFEGRSVSMPLGFWSEQDVLQYIHENNIEIASVYGEVKKDGNNFYTTGRDRTGCLFCMFGVEQEKGENRFQKLQTTHPELHDYCMNKLELKKVLDFIGVNGYKEN